MATTKTTHQFVQVPKTEYMHLRLLDKEFRHFLNYMKQVRDVEEARDDTKAGRVKLQEQVFAELGL